MAENQPKETINDVMAKLSNEPGSHGEALQKLIQKWKNCDELTKIIEEIQETLQWARIIITYKQFDLEATTRERDELLARLEDYDD